MNKIKMDFQHCFGIDKLEYEFDFTDNNVYSIYARNGLMKTSFAKTLQKIQNGKSQEIEDVIFEDAGVASVKVDGQDISASDVFVINSFDASYESDISSLLIKDDIKVQLGDVLKAKDKFMKAMEKASGLKIKRTTGGKAVYELETTIISDFGFEEHSILMNVERLSNETAAIDCGEISYVSIFDSTVLKKILSDDFQNSIQQFIEGSNRVYDSFGFLEKGKLTLPKLKDIRKTLDKDSFFVKQNKLILSGGDEVGNVDTLSQKIGEIETAIRELPEMKAIEDMLGDAKGMLLKDVIETHPEIVPFLSRENLPELKKSLWRSYIDVYRSLYEDMVNKYQLFSEAVNAVDLSDNPWRQALDVFNKRFSVPFKMKVVNLKSAIIGESIPQIEFSFQKEQRTVSISRSRLEEIDTLSQGEKRALYLLNIIFDLEKIKDTGRDILLIIDDIADSFDYKNKYAIIEYLYELSKESNIKMIILSHNYDFYRTVSSRLSIKRQCRLFADKDSSTISLVQEKYQNQPFEYWKKNPNKIFVMALIPFVRNLAEYGKERNISGKGEKADFLMLTSLLHEKNNTNQIKFADILPLYDGYMGITKFEQDINESDYVIPTLYSVCDTITDKNTELEYKILLAIAIRHKAEIFMIQKIKNYAGQLVWNKGTITGNSTDFLNYVDTKGIQTRELMNGYNQFGDNVSMKIISEVNIMTPENIHLNSFMYEPILDMDIIELLNLYNQVKCL